MCNNFCLCLYAANVLVVSSFFYFMSASFLDDPNFRPLPFTPFLSNGSSNHFAPADIPVMSEELVPGTPLRRREEEKSFVSFFFSAEGNGPRQEIHAGPVANVTCRECGYTFFDLRSCASCGEKKIFAKCHLPHCEFTYFKQTVTCVGDIKHGDEEHMRLFRARTLTLRGYIFNYSASLEDPVDQVEDRDKVLQRTFVPAEMTMQDLVSCFYKGKKPVLLTDKALSRTFKHFCEMAQVMIDIPPKEFFGWGALEQEDSRYNDWSMLEKQSCPLWLFLTAEREEKDSSSSSSSVEEEEEEDSEDNEDEEVVVIKSKSAATSRRKLHEVANGGLEDGSKLLLGRRANRNATFQTMEQFLVACGLDEKKLRKDRLNKIFYDDEEIWDGSQTSKHFKLLAAKLAHDVVQVRYNGEVVSLPETVRGRLPFMPLGQSVLVPFVGAVTDMMLLPKSFFDNQWIVGCPFPSDQTTVLLIEIPFAVDKDYARVVAELQTLNANYCNIEEHFTNPRKRNRMMFCYVMSIAVREMYPETYLSVLKACNIKEGLVTLQSFGFLAVEANHNSPVKSNWGVRTFAERGRGNGARAARGASKKKTTKKRSRKESDDEEDEEDDEDDDDDDGDNDEEGSVGMSAEVVKPTKRRLNFESENAPLVAEKTVAIQNFMDKNAHQVLEAFENH